MILSESIIDEILCPIIIFVICGISFLNAFLINLSVFVSTALVESSKINILGFLSSALAIQSLCLCPPETFVPPRSIIYTHAQFDCPLNFYFPNEDFLLLFQKKEHFFVKPSLHCHEASLYHNF